MFALKKLQDAVTYMRFGTEPPVMKSLFYDLVDKDMSGEEVQMSQFKDSVLLLVNVASK